MPVNLKNSVISNVIEKLCQVWAENSVSHVMKHQLIKDLKELEVDLYPEDMEIDKDSYDSETAYHFIFKINGEFYGVYGHKDSYEGDVNIDMSTFRKVSKQTITKTIWK